MILDDLRRYAVARSLFPPISLKAAVEALGFVQADPIRAPARAQDLILRHRVNNYRAGDLEHQYATLDVEEDFFINYVSACRLRADAPACRGAARARRYAASRASRKRAGMLLEFVRERGSSVHPREVDEYFAHGKVTNYWGGSSECHDAPDGRDALSRDVACVAARGGMRIYAPREHQPVALTAAGGGRAGESMVLVDTLVRIYAPLPASSLTSHFFSPVALCGTSVGEGFNGCAAAREDEIERRGCWRRVVLSGG